MVYFILFFILASTAHASESTQGIVINEVMIEPSQRIEILNTSESPIDISGWYLDDDGGSSYVTLHAGITLPPNSCFTITGNFNLNKTSSDTVRLFDSKEIPTLVGATPVDSYSYDLSPGEGYSFQRIPDGSPNWETTKQSIGLWNTSLVKCQLDPSINPTVASTPTATPTTKQIEPLTNIRISEVMVYPDSGEFEWIELYNPNNFEVMLGDWYIDDAAETGSSPRKFSLSLPANGYGVYELSSGIFNNTGDSVRLLDSKAQLIDNLTYTTSKKNITLGRTSIVENNFCLQEPTKGYANENCIVEESELTETPKPTPTSFTSPISSSLNMSKTSKPTRYTIHAKLPIIAQMETTQVLGVDDYTSQKTIRRKPKASWIIPPAYSLLSIISLTVKMKLK